MTRVSSQCPVLPQLNPSRTRIPPVMKRSTPMVSIRRKLEMKPPFFSALASSSSESSAGRYERRLGGCGPFVPFRKNKKMRIMERAQQGRLIPNIHRHETETRAPPTIGPVEKATPYKRDTRPDWTLLSPKSVESARRTRMTYEILGSVLSQFSRETTHSK